MKKKNQHYVYRAYLKPWAENGRIYCLRGGEVFHSNLRNVACERFFYRLQELTPLERQLIESSLVEHSVEPLKTVQRQFIEMYSLPAKIRKARDKDRNLKLESVLEELTVNLGEDFHQRVEDSLLVFLNLMLAGKTDFYSSDKQAAEFLAALCFQFTRTKRAREAAVSQLGVSFKGCNVRRVIDVLSYLVGMALGLSFYVDRKAFRVLVLENNTNTPFITADQPVINLNVTFDGNPPDKVEFFYPLSPAKAMLLVESSNKRGDVPMSPIYVNDYNALMVRNSHEQVFSNSKEYLASIKDVVALTRGSPSSKIVC